MAFPAGVAGKIRPVWKSAGTAHACVNLGDLIFAQQCAFVQKQNIRFCTLKPIYVFFCVAVSEQDLTAVGKGDFFFAVVVTGQPLPLVRVSGLQHFSKMLDVVGVQLRVRLTHDHAHDPRPPQAQ